jgi:hypothetical protein
MAFKPDKAAIERFVKHKGNNLFAAVGLPLDADRDDVLERVKAIRRVHSNADLNAAMRSVDPIVKDVRTNQKKWNDYASSVRSMATVQLMMVLDIARDNEGDGVIDSREERDYYTFGLESGFTRDELQKIFAKYVREHDVKRAPAAKPKPAPAPKPAPTRRPAPKAKPAAASRPAPKPKPAAASRPAPKPTSSHAARSTPHPSRTSSARVGTMEERVRWGVVAASSSAGAGALAVVAFTHLGRPTFRMFLLAGLVAWAIHSLHERKLWQLVTALAVATFLVWSNPVMMGVLLGIVGAGAAAWVTHWLRGKRALAGALATLTFLTCLGSGMVQGSYYLKVPLGSRLQSRRVTEAAPVTLPVNPSADSRSSSTQAPPAQPSTKVWTDPVKVKFTSKPSGAEVRLGSKRIGTTPCETPLKAGSYTVILRKEGFEDSRTTFKVDPNASIIARSGKLVTVTLSPLPVRAVEGTWNGQFDEKPFRLDIEKVSADGSWTGKGAITLSSGAQSFVAKGRVDLGRKQITFKDVGTGMEFTGTMAEKSMTGSAEVPGLDLVRRWSLTAPSKSP